MPTTRAARRAARCLTEVLPADALSLVLYQLPLAHDIAAVAPTCHVFDDAAKMAKLRRLAVATLPHTVWWGPAAVPDGRIITGRTTTPSRCGATARASAHPGAQRGHRVRRGAAGRSALRQRRGRVYREAVGNRRPSSALSRWACWCLRRGAARRRALCGRPRHRSRRPRGPAVPRRRDARPHLEGHNAEAPLATLDGQHIISGSIDNLVKVWSVATKSLVSTCEGHTDGVVAAAMPDGQRILGLDGQHRPRWLLDGPRTHLSCTPTRWSRGAARQPARAPPRATRRSSSTSTTAVLCTFRHHTDPVMCLALLSDGRRFVSASKTRPPASSSTACAV